MINRRIFIGLASLTILSGCGGGKSLTPPPSPQRPPPGTVVGAIRWDAWVGDSDPVGAAVDKTLGPNQYHFRLPFYGQVTGTDSVIVNGATQAIMDQEITYAHNAGLSYWAFVYYPDNPGVMGLSTARKLYLSSSLKGLINYSLILSDQGYDLPTLINWFSDPSYQKVLNGRPLIFFLNAPTSTEASISQIRSAAASAGVANPYIVLLYTTAEAISIGADAVSNYVTAGANGEPYSSLVNTEIGLWNQTGFQTIPWVSTGWDPRPRIQTPVPWGTYPSNSWVQTATPSEIANHLNDAFYWIGSHPNQAPANAILMYAWNEFDEGGWICPTLSNGSDRLNAISNIIASASTA